MVPTLGEFDNRRRLDTTRSIDRALRILDLLATSGWGFGVTTIASELGLSAATVCRMLETLRRRGYVERTDTGKYRLGMRFVTIGTEILRRIDMRAEAREYMKALSARVRELTVLGVLDDKSVVCVEVVDVAQRVHVSMGVGTRIPLHSTALGKAILAYLPDNEVREALAAAGGGSAGGGSGPGVEAGDPRLHEVAAVAELERVRRSLFSVEIDDTELGLSGVASPVFNYREEVVGSVGIMAPTVRWRRDELVAVAPSVVDVAGLISERLGSRTCHRGSAACAAVTPDGTVGGWTTDEDRADRAAETLDSIQGSDGGRRTGPAGADRS